MLFPVKNETAHIVQPGRIVIGEAVSQQRKTARENTTTRMNASRGVAQENPASHSRVAPRKRHGKYPLRLNALGHLFKSGFCDEIIHFRL